MGIFMIAASEAVSIYLIKYESHEALVQLKSKFWQDLGMGLAIPILLFILYFTNHSQMFLAFALVSAVLAFFRSASLIIKVYLVDKLNIGDKNYG